MQVIKYLLAALLILGPVAQGAFAQVPLSGCSAATDFMIHAQKQFDRALKRLKRTKGRSKIRAAKKALARAREDLEVWTKIKDNTCGLTVPVEPTAPPQPTAPTEPDYYTKLEGVWAGLEDTWIYNYGGIGSYTVTLRRLTLLANGQAYSGFTPFGLTKSFNCTQITGYQFGNCGTYTNDGQSLVINWENGNRSVYTMQPKTDELTLVKNADLTLYKARRLNDYSSYAKRYYWKNFYSTGQSGLYNNTSTTYSETNSITFEPGGRFSASNFAGIVSTAESTVSTDFAITGSYYTQGRTSGSVKVNGLVAEYTHDEGITTKDLIFGVKGDHSGGPPSFIYVGGYGLLIRDNN